MSGHDWQVARAVWEGLSDVDARWARSLAAVLATLHPREYVKWSLRNPVLDLAAGPEPFVVAWTFDDDMLVVEVTGNPILRGAMRLTTDQENGLRMLGFEQPHVSAWFPGRSGYWRLQADFMDVGRLGVILVALMTGVMDLAHPALAPVDQTSEEGPFGERPCLHPLYCTCRSAV